VTFFEVEEWVRANLPPAPARVLEVGAGDGSLAASLTATGYDVTAIDPKSEAPNVEPVSLTDFTADERFDAAVAVVSLHHVEPLLLGATRLANALQPNAPFLVDEFAVERLDARAARWWLEQRRALGQDEPESAAELIEKMLALIHPVERVRQTLAEFFDVGPPIVGTYLYRWKLGESFRAKEERLIADDELPCTGVRFIATRRPR
jgi:SAM-dependent methyltransferase